MVTLNQNLYPLEQYGLINPTNIAQGPFRETVVQNGDGLFLEEGTTNLITNPGFTAGTASWAGIGSTTIAQSSTRAMFGSQSLLVNFPAAATPTTAGANYAISTGVLANSTVYTASCYVYVPVGAPDVYLSIQGAIVASSQSSSVITTKGKWVRATVTFTSSSSAATSTGNIFLLNNTTVASVSQAVWLDGVQLEQKGWASTYCDGGRATPWNGPGYYFNWDFEAGTTASWVVSAGTLANSGAQFYQGSKSLLATASAANLNVTSPQGTAGLPVTVGKIYTSSMWVRPSAARQLRCDVVWYNAAGTFISTTNGTAITGVANTWQRLATSGLAPANAAYGVVELNVSDSVNTDTFYIDAARIDYGVGCAGYRWNGAENASTSTRQTAGLAYACAVVPSTVTMAGITRIGGAAAVTGNNPSFACLNDGTGNNAFTVSVSGNPAGAAVVATKTVGGTAVTATSSVTVVPGDLLAWVLRFDGTNLKLTVSKNGAAAVTTTTASATVPATPTGLSLSNSFLTNAQGNSPTEQYLVFNRVLSDTEVTNLLALTVELAFTDTTFTGIIFEAAASGARGLGDVALSTTGTGSYRAQPGIPCFSEILTTADANNPEDDTATNKITVAANSGIGEGQLVSFAPVGSTVYTVQRIVTGVGAYDELYVA